MANRAEERERERKCEKYTQGMSAQTSEIRDRLGKKETAIEQHNNHVAKQTNLCRFVAARMERIE